MRVEVVVEYKNSNIGEVDDALNAMARRRGGRREGSGFFFLRSLRDISWSFKKAAKANLFKDDVRKFRKSYRVRMFEA